MKEVNKFKVLLFLSFSKYITPINFKKKKFAESEHSHGSFISIHTYFFEVNNKANDIAIEVISWENLDTHAI